jgi:hypothetical protein
VTCTGLTAFWCPVHGDCTCERTYYGDCCFDSPSCPLHAPQSQHAETHELEGCREKVTALAEDCGVELSANDHATLSRFAQWLHVRARGAGGT